MKKWIRIVSIIAIAIFVCYLAFFHYTDSYEFGITYNLATGESKPDGHPGYHLSAPWVLVTKVDTRPQKVSIASASRNLNSKLVQFDTAQWRELIKFEGFHYYWWYNRISFNSGQETFRGFRNLLLGHSYGATRGKFVKIIQEIGDEAK